MTVEKRRRGFATIALHNCKDPENVGGVLRAAGCFGADLVVVAGERRKRAMSGYVTDTQKAWKHIPTLVPDDAMSTIPVGAVTVAVDLVEGASDLSGFHHPESAYYIFGPEDGTLPPEIVSKCTYKVMIPCRVCLNLAAAVNVVLYDRQSKSGRA